MPAAKAVAGKTLLSPTDHTLILVDFQGQMAFATKSIDGVVLRNNAALVANAAKGFKLSTILTTVLFARRRLRGWRAWCKYLTRDGQ
jgi:nicotinamidase-related amidase